ncbi:TIM-barrel domain-containing protein [Sphingomonas sp. MS122]|uniref:glycoside hydrolase family 31 protein n=1 Tax=Sphingomonas sp. MS122 TaxID=3412683 RepID=UPI003C309857
MKIAALLSASMIALSVPAMAQSAEGWRKTGTGIVVTPAGGSEKRVELQVYGDGLIRVTESDTPAPKVPESLQVIAAPVKQGFTVSEGNGTVTLATPSLSATVRLADGNVSFRDAGGNAILNETASASFRPAHAEGQSYVAVTQQFNRGTDEGFYGLGQHQNGQFNYNGEDVELAQYNFVAAVPFVVSTRNYGLLWDNNGISRFGNPKPYALAGAPGDSLRVEGKDGRPGWDARYYLGERLAVAQSEQAINYQHIRDLKNWPADAKAKTVAATGGQNTAGNAVETQRVEWSANVTADKSGLHRFRLYGSSYFKLYVDGKLVMDRWRQNWHPWYHNFDVPMTAGKSVDIRIEWEPNAGYLSLHHSDPLPEADRHSLTLTSDLAHAIDYYVVAGKDLDGVVSGYRKLTGKASMLPKWAYGFWQSRQRYDTQKEILDVVKTYRDLKIPLDNIVLDWRYWRDDDWGSHRLEPKRFPDPKGMIDALHQQHANFMISVWPKFYPTTDTYKELAAAGGVYTRNITMGNKDWVGPGYLNTDYDPYNSRARDIYWRQVKERLAVLGVDGWWLDANEPDMHSNLSPEERAWIMGPTARGPGGEFYNSFSLPHSENVYKGQRAMRPDVRPYILSRSAFGGLQRAGATVWSGDVASRWDDLREQIPAGINISMTGIPNWSHDIGGFALEDRYTKQDPAHVDEWRELYLRWFQFGAFSPVFRSHGEFPYRETYNIAPEGSPVRDALIRYTELRYRLMPYIYTLAADTWQKDGSIMRGLVMDFPQDAKVRGIGDQYLFGPALLVTPVTQFKARSRDLYLPAGTDWFDLDTGKRERGGRTVKVDAPAERIPVYVRAGSIIPTGPVMQYVDEKPDAPLTILIYPGADGSFSLYEDDGRSHRFEKGGFSRIPFSYDDATGTLTIGERQGSYKGMVANRQVIVRWMKDGSGIDGTDRLSAPIAYSGRAVTVKRP